ncbi:hypothetical protein [Virgibacillus oceani]|uniref:Uncharacterized protein n=1 Tax=Virgibacillus oceani TaxID=1479511 RepID=A0A917HTR2_9BACI|nr:hypothetical protein [Virgibacillus oceani]GGG88840.1 hypothetical protein GCM10011398_38510 [Virgibacillus oceani]
MMTSAKRINKVSNVIHLSNKLHDELLTILDELFIFSMNHFDSEIITKTNKILSKIEGSKEIKHRIYPQLIWWIIFSCSIGAKNKPIYHLFWGIHQHKWKKKGKAINRILGEWKQVKPSFYIVKSIGDSKRVYELIDIFGYKRLIAGIFNDIYRKAQCGEMVTGTLLPIGDDIYTTPVDFFHIPLSITPKLSWELINHNQNRSLPPEDYPSALEIVLRKM